MELCSLQVEKRYRTEVIVGRNAQVTRKKDSPISLARVKPISRDPQNGQLIGWRDIVK